MLTEDGLKILEFNVRFGDPETQVLLPRWDGDVTATLFAAASGALTDDHAARFSAPAAVCVVLASPGYPDRPETGAPIEGIDEARAVPGAHVYAAGVATGPDGRLAYRAATMVRWPGMVSRSDIADKADPDGGSS
jgi:phosphoribosylamine--glycine ligase